MSYIGGPLPGQEKTEEEQEESLNKALSTGKKIAGALIPDLTDPRETAEYFTDLVSDIKLARGPKGVGIFAGKRLMADLPVVRRAVDAGREIVEPIIKKGQDLLNKDYFEPVYDSIGVQPRNRLNKGGLTDQPTLDEIAARPLQVGHKMERSTRTDTLEGLFRGNVSNKKIRDFLQEGPGRAIKPKYREISADKLAANPELLEQLFKRNKNIKTLQEKYLTKLSQWQKNPRPSTQAAKNNAQRAWYDEVTKNLFDHEMLIYGKDKPRQIVAQFTKWATRDQWHHIFGNKEAGEFFLSMVAQDPLVITNLMKHMKKLKLSTSGIADNIAIMKATGHNNFHLWLKEMGFESVAGKQAPLAIDQYATEISKYITEGVQTTAVSGKPKFYPPNPDAVNDLFGMLEYYAEANKFIRKQLKSGKVTMEDGTVLSLAAGKTQKLPEVMSELKSKNISGVGDVLRSGELMKDIKIGTRGRKVKKKLTN